LRLIIYSEIVLIATKCEGIMHQQKGEQINETNKKSEGVLCIIRGRGCVHREGGSGAEGMNKCIQNIHTHTLGVLLAKGNGQDRIVKRTLFQIQL